MIQNKRILITGITGSIGSEITREFYDKDCEIIGFSRDEFKQYEMKQQFPEVKFIIGDIRDFDCIKDALEYTDICIHTAALKQLPSVQSFPMEGISTNILGGRNVARACREQDVKQVICISTDKAVESCSSYGHSKALCDDIFLKYGFSIARLGNVLPSRGCILYWLEKQPRDKIIPITLDLCSRFWLDVFRVPQFIELILEDYMPNRVYVPKMPSFVLKDLLIAMGFDAWEQQGLRTGEKKDEVIITENENCWEHDTYYLLNDPYTTGKIRITSNRNNWWLSVEDIKEKVNKIFKEEKQNV